MALATDIGTREGIDAVLARATDLMGNRVNAMRWMGTPVAALNYTTPIAALSTPQGKESVLAVLEQAEYGVF